MEQPQAYRPQAAGVGDLLKTNKGAAAEELVDEVVAEATEKTDGEGVAEKENVEVVHEGTEEAKTDAIRRIENADVVERETETMVESREEVVEELKNVEENRSVAMDKSSDAVNMVNEEATPIGDVKSEREVAASAAGVEEADGGRSAVDAAASEEATPSAATLEDAPREGVDDRQTSEGATSTSPPLSGRLPSLLKKRSEFKPEDKAQRECVKFVTSSDGGNAESDAGRQPGGVEVKEVAEKEVAEKEAAEAVAKNTNSAVSSTGPVVGMLPLSSIEAVEVREVARTESCLSDTGSFPAGGSLSDRAMLADFVVRVSAMSDRVRMRENVPLPFDTRVHFFRVYCEAVEIVTGVSRVDIVVNAEFHDDAAIIRTRLKRSSRAEVVQAVKDWVDTINMMEWPADIEFFSMCTAGGLQVETNESYAILHSRCTMTLTIPPSRLYLAILAAQGLRKTGSPCNAYCSFQWHREYLRTRTVAGTSDPHWLEMFDLEYNIILDPTELEVSIYHEGAREDGEDDELLGRVAVPLDYRELPFEEWIPVATQKRGAYICVRVERGERGSVNGSEAEFYSGAAADDVDALAAIWRPDVSE
eukprot:GHVU01193448.1.p1 GENE.GHVU01193448.1~~GHVU01193448.1.p1  ORF type:complete len:590 (+),score=134.68 GHVU01193448.1:806-2575(+)